MCNKMSSPAILCKNNESGMRKCDEFWKVKSEIQSTWDKIYILKYKPDDNIYTSIMKFRYIEDYEKMKKINKMLYEITKMTGTLPKFSSKDRIDFIYEMEEEIKNLLQLVKECYFFNIDYDDGKVFENKFCSINNFIKDRENLNLNFRKLISKLKYSDHDGSSSYLYDILEKEFYPSFKKIYKELRGRGIYKKPE